MCFNCHIHGHLASDFPQNILEKQAPIAATASQDPIQMRATLSEKPEPKGKEQQVEDYDNLIFSGFQANSLLPEGSGPVITNNPLNSEARPSLSKEPDLSHDSSFLIPSISWLEPLSPKPLLSFDLENREDQDIPTPPPQKESSMEFSHRFRDFSRSLAISHQVLVTPSYLESYVDKTKNAPPNTDRCGGDHENYEPNIFMFSLSMLNSHEHLVAENRAHPSIPHSQGISPNKLGSLI